MSEKLCLQWNDFRENILSAFGTLREDVDFADVSLVCEDGQQVDVHKVMLVATSPFFQNLLKRNKHAHPLVYMRGVKFETLLAIVDFLYLGETNINQEHLDSFLSIAEELQLKGLMDQNREAHSQVFKRATQIPDIKQALFQEPKKSQGIVMYDEGTSRSQNKTIAQTNHFSGDLQELDEKVKSLMAKSTNYETEGWKKGYICKVCGKEGQSIHVQNHIESNHLEGFSVPCNLCEKTCRSRNALSKHISNDHN